MRIYVSRMIKERNELAYKIDKLTEFIKNEPAETTTNDQDVLMVNQLRAMELYLFILEQRLAVETELGNVTVEELNGCDVHCDHID